MFHLQPRPVLSLLLAVLALGSLAALRVASEPESLLCHAETAARTEAEPGFVILAGLGDPPCGAELAPARTSVAGPDAYPPFRR